MPRASEWDSKEIFPVDELRQLAGLGFGGIYAREEHGGSGLSRVDAAIIFEALSRGCTSTTAYLSIHNMVAWMIDTFGTSEQRARWVPELTSMAKLGSYCLTEPTCGSDAAALRTRAVLSGGDYVLDGEKAFISGAGETDVYIVMARTGDAGAKGISCFVLEKGMAGLSFGAKLRKLGWNSQPTRPVVMQGVRVPKANLLGAVEGQGFKFAMKGLDGGRINIGACSLGAAAASIEFARAHVMDRVAFGKPLSAFQNVQFSFADSVMQLASARLMIHRAASLLDEGSAHASVHCAMAKRLATDAGFDVCNSALQMLGGYGYIKDYPVERYLRDVRVHQILEGTNEIMRDIVARNIFAR